MQLYGVSGREAGFVVIEGAENLPALAAPGGLAPGPGLLGRVVIWALIGAAGAGPPSAGRLGVAPPHALHKRAIKRLIIVILSAAKNLAFVPVPKLCLGTPFITAKLSLSLIFVPKCNLGTS